jgi:NAD+ synthase (glutamine-hydrolysing)
MSLLQLAIAQFRPAKGDYRGNLTRLGELFAQVDALDPRPAVLALPETALTGYFLEGGVREHALTAGTLARDLDAAYTDAVTSPRRLDVVIGFYEVWRERLFNSAMYVTLGGGEPVIRHVHRKVFLPTYGLFDEERFVERGVSVRSFETPWGRAAMLVCEDVWHSLTGTIAALDGAQILFVPTAPPARGGWPRQDDVPGPASAARWERLARDMAEEHGVYVVLSHLVGSEGGKVFPGGSMVAGPRGDVRARGPLWEEAIVVLPVDLREITRARSEMPLVADLETMLPHLLRSLEEATSGLPPTLAYDSAVPSPRREARSTGREARSAGREAAARPPAESGGKAAAAESRSDAAGGRIAAVGGIAPTPPPLEIDGELVERWLIGFLREEFSRRGFGKAIVGLSGGVDSAVTAYLAARALGPENLVALRMPYRTSSPESLDHAQEVIDALGCVERTIDISAAVDALLADEPDASPSRRGNVMARMRMVALFDQSAKEHALPVGTGNKTERLFGYFTWHADDSPPINPLGDLFKTQVWALARHLGVPDQIVSKPPTADLVVGQTDEGDFGISYPRADELLNWMLAGYTAADLLERGFDADEVDLVCRRLEGTHWKRRLPTVAMISTTTIGEAYLRPVDY